MKNLKVWLVFLPLFSISCSDEYTSEMTELTSVKGYKEKSHVGSVNSVKIFDIAGSAHNEIQETVNEVNIDPLPIEDSQVIPATISVVEYSVAEAEEDRRKDKDWETSVTKIVPKGSRTKESVVAEIKMDVITEVSKKNNTTD